MVLKRSLAWFADQDQEEGSWNFLVCGQRLDWPWTPPEAWICPVFQDSWKSCAEAECEPCISVR